MNDAAMDAYCAGLFDGEGSIGIYSIDGYLRLFIRLVMTDKDTVDKFFEIMGLGIVRRNPPRGIRRASWVWGVYQDGDCSQVLRRLLPYLVAKRGQAELAIAFIRDKSGRQDYVTLMADLKSDGSDFQIPESQQLDFLHTSTISEA